MKRIDTSTRAVNLFGAGKDGFKDGDLALGVAPTALNALWFNQLQEELANVIEDLGVTLSADGSNRAQLLAALKGRFINVQTFTASGTYTPTPGTKWVIARVQGGGGAGGGAAATAAGTVGAAGGGGAGAYVEARITTVPASVVVTVGSGGGAVGNAAGNPGSASSFGALVTAPGGLGGGVGSAATPPTAAGGASNTALPTASGTGVTALVLKPGTGGQPGVMQALGVGFSGRGAESFHGAGGNPSVSGGGNAALGAGAGGSGGLNYTSSGGNAGGNGANGRVDILEFA